jgi:hypothetical protein
MCHSVVTITKDDLYDLLNSDQSLWQHLFPSNRLIMNWVPHAATVDDLESLFHLPIDLQCYGTIGDSPESQGTSEAAGFKEENPSIIRESKDKATSSNSDSKRYSLITAGSYYRCKLGISYLVDVFGQVGDEDDLMLDHLRVHLQRLKGMWDWLSGQVVFNVFAFERLERTVAEATKELSAAFKEPGLKWQEMLNLLERELTL